METDYLLVVTTTRSKKDAENLGHQLVKERLAASAQVQGPIISTYWWQGNFENNEEWKCTFKTSKQLYQKLEKKIQDLHPYITPEIFAVPILRGSNDYLLWLKKELQ